MKLTLDIDSAMLRTRDEPAVVAVLRDAAEQIERHLGYDPGAVHGDIRDSGSDAVVARWEIDNDEPTAALIIHADGIECPHCAAKDTLIEVDKAYRWNNGDVEVTDGRITAMFWGTGDADFEHEGYRCGACDGLVEITQDGIESVDQDWS